jgi:hypothetical protein
MYGLPSHEAGEAHGMSESSVVAQPITRVIAANRAIESASLNVTSLLYEDQVAHFNRPLLPVRKNIADG